METGNLIVQQEIERLYSKVNKQYQNSLTMLNQIQDKPKAATAPSIPSVPVPSVPTMLMHSQFCPILSL